MINDPAVDSRTVCGLGCVFAEGCADEFRSSTTNLHERVFAYETYAFGCIIDHYRPRHIY